MSSRLSECISEQAVLKKLLRHFSKINVYGEVCVLKMVRMLLFAGALKTLILVSQKYF